jgi:hypothetical protein
LSGYANKVIKLDFAELSEDPAADPIWVIIRNPRLMPQKELTSGADSGAYDDNGKIIDRAKAEIATDRLIAKLAVAARVYDATAEASYDPLTGEPLGDGGQDLLPPTPWPPEVAAKLPAAIRLRIAEEFAEALNPPKGQGALTPKTSSGS